MKRNFLTPVRFVAILFFAFVAGFASSAFAQETVGPFRITGTVVHSEAPTPEACVSFSSPVAFPSREALAAGLVLKKEGKRQKVDPLNVMLSAQDLCLQKVDYGARYTLTLPFLRNEKGQRLEKPHQISFTLADRKQALGFINAANPSMFPRYVKEKEKRGRPQILSSGLAPVLRSVNVGAARLILYKLDKRESFAGAWQKFLQGSLTQSESLIFAREQGKNVFESDLVFAGRLNEVQTLVAPLPMPDVLSPGLYYLSAVPQNVTERAPELMAGQWFLVSDVRGLASMTAKGVQFFVTDQASRNPVAGVEAFLMTRDGDVLAETKAGTDGSGFLSFGATGEQKAAYLLIRKESGDLDFLDLSNEAPPLIAGDDVKAFIKTDKQTYVSGEKAIASLWARDLRGEMKFLGDGVLKLLRPDGSVYDEFAAPADKGVSSFEIPLPVVASGETWRLSWKASGNGNGAEAEMRILPSMDEASIELDVEPDRRDVGADGNFTLFLKTRDSSGVAPFKKGRVLVKAVRPENEGWKGYRFGIPSPETMPPLADIRFVTDASGRANLPVKIESGADRRFVQSVRVVAALEGSGLERSVDLSAESSRHLVGVKVAAREVFQPGSQQITFDAVALDAQGRRRSQSGLYYTIIEEGRSFEWMTVEGRWDYRLLPHHRRVGGGPLSLSASGENRIVCNVTPGHYRLIISDEAGRTLTQYAFDSGVQGKTQAAEGNDGTRLLDAPSLLQAKKKHIFSFALDAPSMVAGVFADDRVRHVFHRHFPAGKHEIAVTPTEAWGREVSLRLYVSGPQAQERRRIEKTFAVANAQEQMELVLPKLPREMTAGNKVVLPLRVKGFKPSDIPYVRLVASFSPKDDALPPPAPFLAKQTQFDVKGNARLQFDLASFEGEAKLEFTVWNKAGVVQNTTTLRVRPDLAVSANVPEYIQAGDRVELDLEVRNNDLPTGLFDFEFRVPENLSLRGAGKGRVNLRKGGRRPFSFALTAREKGSGNVELVLSSASGARRLFVWPVTVRSSVNSFESKALRSLAPGETLDLQKEGETGVVFAGPFPLPDFVPLLETFAESEPQTTNEIALWLETMDMWEAGVAGMGLISGERLQALRAERLYQLKLRQNSDGGFSAREPKEPSDMASTASALAALAGKADRQASMASAWLAQKLQNTWFDENERDSRALAFASLARAGKAEVSALRYFAQTSADKNLSPSASAAIGYALFSGTKDAEASGQWETRARRKNGPLPYQALYWLSFNDVASVEELTKSLESEVVPSATSPLERKALWLVAYAQTGRRTGSWHIEADGEDRKIFGVFSMPVGLKTKIKNVSGEKLNVREVARRKNPQESDVRRDNPAGENAVTLRRTLYNLKGETVSAEGNLNVGESYLLLIEAESRKPLSEPLRVRAQSSSAFDLSLPVDGDHLRRSYPWLSSSATRTVDRSITPRAAGFAFEGMKGPWRAAIFITPVESGNYKLPAVTARSGDGSVLPAAATDMRREVLMTR